MLAGLFVLAIANGFFLGLTLYGLLAAVLKIIHGHAPGFVLLRREPELVDTAGIGVDAIEGYGE